MLNNKADIIEDYILRMLEQSQDKQLELKRTELADEVSCAPSQISYVLSTRFSNSRGYKVESRRGMGGYIRIAIIDDKAEKDQFLKKIAGAIRESTSFEDVKFLLRLLMREKFITVREAELIAQLALNIFNMEYQGRIQAEERTELIRSMFNTLANIG